MPDEPVDPDPVPVPELDEELESLDVELDELSLLVVLSVEVEVEGAAASVLGLLLPSDFLLLLPEYRSEYQPEPFRMKPVPREICRLAVA